MREADAKVVAPAAAPAGRELPELRRRRYRTLLISLTLLALALTAVRIYLQGLRVSTSLANNIVVFALEHLYIILLSLLILLILRNLVKFVLEERRRQAWGSFRSKLIMAFVGLSLIPSILLFLVASGLVRSSIEGWFTVQVEKALSDSLSVAQQYYRNSERQALFYAERVMRQVLEGNLLEQENDSQLAKVLDTEVRDHPLDALQVFDLKLQQVHGVQRASVEPDILLSVDKGVLQQALKGKATTEVASVGVGDVIRGIQPIRKSAAEPSLGLVVVSYYVPRSLVARMGAINRTFEEYRQLKLLRKPVTSVQIMTFLMITLALVFSGTWLAFYLAKRITIPIEELAEGTRRVAAGNLDVHIDVQVDDEVGTLVRAFNQMTDDLRKSRQELHRANLELKQSNLELDERRTYMETVLESIATGVISIDSTGRISTINKSAARILGRRPEALRGRHYREVFHASELNLIRNLIRRMHEQRRPSIEDQITVQTERGLVTLLTSVAVLCEASGAYRGMVVVFDDLTELIKAQKVAAWREVARGLAHEIKNPLTPIQLSAQRLRRQYRSNGGDFGELLAQCTGTIIEQVEGLKALVNEFSKFARMPEAKPRPNELRQIIDDVVLLYQSSHRYVSIEAHHDPRISTMSLDGEQMRRVFINLIENAIEAMNGSGGRVDIRTELLDAEDHVRIEVRDNGRGIGADDLERLFLPYFSTKKRGTGLGLAIVNRIIADHGGSICAKPNEHEGATFVIELPRSAPNRRALPHLGSVA
ncbi:MAG: HAMP domain-containing protein [Candidatus Tectomicrobia bacterium]|nr:HAMP domain-containing protein [Candidatus Tectomicrobia bacterium]